MTDPRSLADLLNPEVVRGYLREAGYQVTPQPAMAQLPHPADVPAAPPPQQVEYRGVVEFQAFWELPATVNRSRTELIEDVMNVLAGQEANWLPRLRYHVTSLTRMDPGMIPPTAAAAWQGGQAVDPRPLWRDPRGNLWRVNPDGSLTAESNPPPAQPVENGWRAAEGSAAEAVRLRAAMETAWAANVAREEEIAYAQRLSEAPEVEEITGLEQLGAQLRQQLEDMETQRRDRREARRQRRLRGGDVPADGTGGGELYRAAVPPHRVVTRSASGGPNGDSAGTDAPPVDARDDGGGGRDDAGERNAQDAGERATRSRSDALAGRAEKPRRRAAVELATEDPDVTTGVTQPQQ